jgi:hypothetical protein
VKEYEIYFPSARNDGTRVDASAVEGFKAILTQAFGGYTHLRQRGEGAWRLGGVTFYDEVTIVRVIDEGRREFDMSAFKRMVEAKLNQETVLIVSREVSVVP